MVPEATPVFEDIYLGAVADDRADDDGAREDIEFGIVRGRS